MVVDSNAVMVSSESNEWGTQWKIIEAARATMGSIHFDPCTTYAYNSEVVLANYCFTIADNGFLIEWVDYILKYNIESIWMNPPYGRKNIKKKIYTATAWIKKLIHVQDLLKHKYDYHVEVCILARNSNASFPLIRNGFMSCEPDYRLPFVDLNTGVLQEHPQHVSNVYYRGIYFDRFAKEFRDIGYIRGPAACR